MKITATKIKRELLKNHGWDNVILESVSNRFLVNEVIKHTLKIVDEILIREKGISIK